RLRVVYEAADPVFRVVDGAADGERRRQVLDRYAIPQGARLLLYVGGFGPHKNLETLLEAFARLRGATPASTGGTVTVGDPPALHLALVGETTKEVFYSSYATLCEHVRRLDLGQHVTFTGYVPDADLVDLYHAATCLVLPSWDEGFGLPAVEAMACGTPVVASRAGALPEVVGDAGLLVAPDRPEDWTGALRRLVSQPQLGVDLRERGLRRAAQFSWERAATEMLDLCEELVLASHGVGRRGVGRLAGHA
ncbi:MAG: glycosyltransferase family 4 protein, partial [Chloroflexi bacterium]|nr:glycosyltransferase family 4 protein [Chloroflexota bacterium]